MRTQSEIYQRLFELKNMLIELEAEIKRVGHYSQIGINMRDRCGFIREQIKCLEWVLSSPVPADKEFDAFYEEAIEKIISQLPNPNTYPEDSITRVVNFLDLRLGKSISKPINQDASELKIHLVIFEKQPCSKELVWKQVLR